MAKSGLSETHACPRTNAPHSTKRQLSLVAYAIVVALAIVAFTTMPKPLGFAFTAYSGAVSASLVAYLAANIFVFGLNDTRSSVAIVIVVVGLGTSFAVSNTFAYQDLLNASPTSVNYGLHVFYASGGMYLGFVFAVSVVVEVFRKFVLR